MNRAVRGMRMAFLFFFGFVGLGCGLTYPVSSTVPLSLAPAAPPSRGVVETRARASALTGGNWSSSSSRGQLFVPRLQLDGGAAFRITEEFGIRGQFGWVPDVEAIRLTEGVSEAPARNGFLTQLSPFLAIPLDSAGRQHLAIGADVGAGIGWESVWPDACSAATEEECAEDRQAPIVFFGGQVTYSQWVSIVRLSGTLGLRSQPTSSLAEYEDFGQLGVLLGAEVLLQVHPNLFAAVEVQWLAVVDSPLLLLPAVGLSVGATLGEHANDVVVF